MLDFDLSKAALAALTLSRQRCREHALAHDWTESARQFLDNLAAGNQSPGRTVQPVAAPSLIAPGIGSVGLTIPSE